MVFQPKSYKWRDGFAYQTSAEIVGGVVEQIEARDGEVTRESFLEESRPEDAPTHSMFEWDDTVAAEAYRLDQSRKIITNLQIVYVNNQEEKESIPAVLNIASDRKAVYQNIVTVLSNEESRDLVLNRLQREVDQLIERNRHIDGFLDILRTALEKLEKTA